MTVPTTFSNILIEGNTIDTGSTATSPVTVFTYNVLVSTGSDCRVFNNYFSGITNSSPPTFSMIIADNASCNIQGNTFVRGSSAIDKYIKVIGIDDQIITGNIFDGYTTDGSSLTNVSVPANTIYHSNKNQVGYSIIPLGTEKTAIHSFTQGIVSNSLPLYNWINESNTGPNFTLNSLGVNDGGVLSGFLYDHYVLKLYNAQTSPTDQYFSIGIDITKSIPIGAKIIDAKISIFNPSTVTLDTSSINSFSLALNASRSHTNAIDIKTYNSTGLSSWMLQFNSLATLNINAGNEANLRSNYQTIEIPTLNFSGFVVDSLGNASSVANSDISSNFVSGNDYNITAKLQFLYKGTTTGNPIIPLILVSPLILTYVF